MSSDALHCIALRRDAMHRESRVESEPEVNYGMSDIARDE